MQPISPRDREILRTLARQVAELAASPAEVAKRQSWTNLLSLRPSAQPLVQVGIGMYNAFCRDLFADGKMSCTHPEMRAMERELRLRLFQEEIGDDTIQEPWFTVRATVKPSWHKLWGVTIGHELPDEKDGAWKLDPPIKDWADMAKLVAPAHGIDEAATAAQFNLAQDCFGDLLPVAIDRGPACIGGSMDIAHFLCQLRGLEQVMIDMYESPDELHRLLAFMRDGILANQQAAEDAGDYSLLSQVNQSMTYCDELPAPVAHSAAVTRRQLWGFSAAQEYTLVSPDMHDEFMLQYQLPILEKFGLTAYGCCEDLTRKIDLLRKIRNLRIIAVTPTANVAACAEQIGRDYVISWRPNPTDMVCGSFDEARIRRVLRAGLEPLRDKAFLVFLKDVETVEGEPERLRRWVNIARDELAHIGHG